MLRIEKERNNAKKFILDWLEQWCLCSFERREKTDTDFEQFVFEV